MHNDFIKNIYAREILDSRGNPTLEVEVKTEQGFVGIAAVPSGASVGENEALELRDGDQKRYQGKGVLKSIQNIEQKIAENLIGFSISEQKKIDALLIKLDATENKANLGANTLLAISLAVAAAAAQSTQLPLWAYLKKCFGVTKNPLLPIPLMNVVNGGAHADNGLSIQEFMLVPLQEKFSERLRAGVEIFHTLKKILQTQKHITAVGDEGGFAPRLSSQKAVMDLLLDAIQKAGYQAGSQIALALDVAASEFYDKEKKQYFFEGKYCNSQEMIAFFEDWTAHYPLISLEDPLDQNDWEGWKLLTEKLGQKVDLVGDDLFVTQKKYLQKGITEKIANAILIKMNQVGTLSETAEVIQLAQEKGYRTIISHRSGETEDTFMADLCVGLSADRIKTGGLCRSERVAKYNQLLRISEQVDL